jgi:hypothetical protein
MAFNQRFRPSLAGSTAYCAVVTTTTGTGSFPTSFNQVTLSTLVNVNADDTTNASAITIREAGVYMVGFHVSINVGQIGNWAFGVGINGAAPVISAFATEPVATYRRTLAASGLLALNQGDVVRLYMAASSATIIQTEGSYGGLSQFYLERVA